mmetsp:Transcript_9175/g.24356  ORF Transcript_9175/g.24356 Transcript_9175/m.24356 type:complete len:228 (-) Transcript_9175:10-693(-)
MVSTPSFFRNSRTLSGWSLQSPAITEAQSWRAPMGLSRSAKNSTSSPTAPSLPSSSRNSWPILRATCMTVRHFFCTSRLRVAWSSLSTTSFPCACRNVSGTYCTRWKSAESTSSCTLRRCSMLHSLWSGGSTSGSRCSRSEGTRPQRVATCAHSSAEQHFDSVPHRSIRNSMSSWELVSITKGPLQLPCEGWGAPGGQAPSLAPAAASSSSRVPPSISSWRRLSETA